MKRQSVILRSVDEQPLCMTSSSAFATMPGPHWGWAGIKVHLYDPKVAYGDLVKQFGESWNCVNSRPSSSYATLGLLKQAREWCKDNGYHVIDR
jgi:hypothetical protein